MQDRDGISASDVDDYSTADLDDQLGATRSVGALAGLAGRTCRAGRMHPAYQRLRRRLRDRGVDRHTTRDAMQVMGYVARMISDPEHPERAQWGEASIVDHLVSAGIRPPRHRVRRALQAPRPRAFRAQRRPFRRRYYAPCPCWSWHMDANLKLRFGGLSVFGDVDAYSRKKLYCSPAICRTGDCHLQGIAYAVRLYGTPRIGRWDCGTENIAAAAFISTRGGRNVFGTSIGDVRAERLWRTYPYPYPLCAGDLSLEWDSRNLGNRREVASGDLFLAQETSR